MTTMTFYDYKQKWDWDKMTAFIEGATPADVERVLAKGVNISPEDFAVLVSPAASGYLEEMARMSAEATRRRFGRTMQRYTPLYISNY